MSVLNLEAPRTVSGVASLQNLDPRGADHLDDRDFVNAHAKVLLGHRVVTLIVEGGISSEQPDHGQRVT
jgi:hypothetical protein